MSVLIAQAPLIVLLLPLSAAVLLALVPAYRLASRLNVLASLLTLLAASMLFIDRPAYSMFRRICFATK